MSRYLLPFGVLLLSACGASGAPDRSSAGTAQIGGEWVRAEPFGTLRIVKAGDEWRVSVVAAGLPRGMATATDCFGEAVGTLSGATLTANIVPFDNEWMEVRQEDLDRDPPGPLVIRFAGSEATVVDHGMANFCGVGSMVGGVYKKKP